MKDIRLRNSQHVGILWKAAITGFYLDPEIFLGSGCSFYEVKKKEDESI
jgi:hypothetical protein